MDVEHDEQGNRFAVRDKAAGDLQGKQSAAREATQMIRAAREDGAEFGKESLGDGRDEASRAVKG